jgi:hypothetical protein
MPSKSKAQAKFMAAAAHNPAFAKKAGIKPAVARDFIAADSGKGKAAMRKLPARVAPKHTIAGGY